MESLHAVVAGIFFWRRQRIAAAADTAEDEKTAAVTVLYRVAAWRTLQGEATALLSAWPALSIGCPIERDSCQLVLLHVCMFSMHSVLLCVWYWGYVWCTVLFLCWLLMQSHHTVLFHCFVLFNFLRHTHRCE
ncbi:hypothetical protein TcCL_ESM05378 [Trypanosoma cruzi]|nr:hypothetical protein TcCL_ESM05378 [Trypanosoma cruzi]